VEIPLLLCWRNGIAVMMFSSNHDDPTFRPIVQPHADCSLSFANRFKQTYLALLRVKAVADLGLTTRQKLLLPLMTLGLPTKQIAHQIGVTEQAVSKVICKISLWFDVSMRMGIVALSVRLAILDPPPGDPP
jgi:hypothetical protein